MGKPHTFARGSLRTEPLGLLPRGAGTQSGAESFRPNRPATKRLIVMLQIHKPRRVIDALRQDFPGDWHYDPSTHCWRSIDRASFCRAVHIPGYGVSYHVYRADGTLVGIYHP